MRYLVLLALGAFLPSCSPQMRQFAPNHVGISPSVEWEIQEGCKTKHKPKVSSSIDWNF